MTNEDLSASETPKPLRRLVWPRGLSGKLLILTVCFIMLTEILVFVPSIANYRLTWLARQFTTAEAAALALTHPGASEVPDYVNTQLLELTETEMIGLRRQGRSMVVLSRDMPRTVDKHVALQEPGRLAALRSIVHAFDTLIFGGERYIRIFGPVSDDRSATLEMVMRDRPLRKAMLTYAGNVLLISLLISLATAILIFLVLRWFMIRPLQQMTRSMIAFSREPDDKANIIAPSHRRDEIGVAEEQLSAMQKTLRSTMNQQRHLAELGLAVAKINHDLRNILASVSLFSERLSSSEDPAVQRLAPRLVGAIDRAVDYTQSVLAYGKSGEEDTAPALVRLHRLAEDVAEVLGLDLDETVEWVNAIPPDMEVSLDPDQTYRVLLNLARNAVQAMAGREDGTDLLVNRLTMSADLSDGAVHIRVTDTGPGFPEAARDAPFAEFQNSSRATGSGLGLAIAADLVKAQGGTIALEPQTEPGTTFEIVLPQ